MIRIFPASSRYSNDLGWLKSNLSFSFADYYDPDNVGFGPLRVFNDDSIAGHRGFGAHPHREMEIVSVVLSGQLKHEDSLGHTAVTTYGGIQRMTAGSGIIHSEMNPGDEDVSLLQLWFTPERTGLAPSYETSEYDPEAMVNRLLPIVSSEPGPGVARIHQDMTIYLSRPEPERQLDFTQAEGRRMYVFVIDGDLTLNGEYQLAQRDAARIEATPQLSLRTETGARFMLIDLP